LKRIHVPKYPPIGFVAKLRVPNANSSGTHLQKVRYVQGVDAPTCYAGLTQLKDLVIHVKTSKELARDRDNAIKRGADEKALIKISFQILLDAETLKPATHNNMTCGGKYYLVSQTGRTQHVRYVYIVAGESQSSIAVEESWSWCGWLNSAPEFYQDIIDGAMDSMVPVLTKAPPKAGSNLA
jgi:hypothetical protein